MTCQIVGLRRGAAGADSIYGGYHDMPAPAECHFPVLGSALPAEGCLWWCFLCLG